MNRSEMARRYCEVVLGEGMRTTAGRLRFHMHQVFEDVPLQGARMLDVGGGSGMCSLWAAAMGAEEVICLEPEQAGSTRGVREKFERMRDNLGVTARASIQNVTIQDYETDKLFDVILLHNSINHLDETACIHLREGEEYKDRYRAIFSKFGRWLKPGGTLIALDCSNENFFADRGKRNPFAGEIEWHKHQSPEVWAALLSEFGLRDPRIGWTSYNAFRTPGRLLLGNRLVAYFMRSHFRLEMTRQ